MQDTDLHSDTTAPTSVYLFWSQMWMRCSLYYVHRVLLCQVPSGGEDCLISGVKWACNIHLWAERKSVASSWEITAMSTAITLWNAWVCGCLLYKSCTYRYVNEFLCFMVFISRRDKTGCSIIGINAPFFEEQVF